MTTSPTLPSGIPEDVLDLVTRTNEYSDDRGWIPWAWDVLARACVVPAVLDVDDQDYPEHLLTLAGLSHLHDQFAEVRSGGDAAIEPTHELHGDLRPEISVIEIGRYSERHDIVDGTFPETVEGLVRESILGQATAVHQQLLRVLGEGRLFTSLELSRSLDPLEETDDASPLASAGVDGVDAHASRVLNSDVTADVTRTFSWLRGDLDLG